MLKFRKPNDPIPTKRLHGRTDGRSDLFHRARLATAGGNKQGL